MVLVEGFFGCIHVWQAGFPAVALLGSSLSEEQEFLICSYFTNALLLFDGDDAGRQCAEDCLQRLGRKIWVKVEVLEEYEQPDHIKLDKFAILVR